MSEILRSSNSVSEEVLFIRADANSQMGTGHVMRCIALGQAWQDSGGKVCFISACTNEFLLNRLRTEDFEVIHLTVASPDKRDAEDTIRLINERGHGPVPRLVIDGYHFDEGYQQQMLDAGIRLACIDDYNHLDSYACNVLLNQNTKSDGLDYVLRNETNRLLGPYYALLRREFRSGFAPIENCQPDAVNILVTLGGGDPDNVSGTVLHALRDLNRPELHVRILIGAANPNRGALKAAAETCRFNVELLDAVSDMRDLYLWADMAVSAGGSTCWELCLAGLPFLVVVIADNQRRIAEGLAEAGAAVNLGWYETLEADTMVEEIGRVLDAQQLRAGMSSCGKELVDGQGAMRVAEALK